MFIKSIEDIFTTKALKKVFADIRSKAVGLDGVSLTLFKEDLTDNLKELQSELLRARYTPEPLKHITIEKEDETLRPLGLSSLRDKIVQKTLALALTAYYEPHFNDKNYGFRRKKDTLKAVARCKDVLQKVLVLKSLMLLSFLLSLRRCKEKTTLNASYLRHLRNI